MNILYHLTRPQYVPSILVRGLIPAAARGLTSPRVIRDDPFRASVIWLTDDYNYIRTQQDLPENPFKIIEINAKDLEIEKYVTTHYYRSVNQYNEDPTTFPHYAPHEFLHRGPIEATRLRVVQ